jgi:hypothetical protein
MKPLAYCIAIVSMIVFCSIPILLSADCDMMAMIGIQNTTLGTLQYSDGEFNDPNDYFDFLRSRSGPSDMDNPLNSDGYGIIYYVAGNSLVDEEQQFYKTGFNTWYLPDNHDPMDNAEGIILNPSVESTIVLGHVRLATGGVGSHPFLLKWNGITYSFMHNGTITSSTKEAFMNYLGSEWFIEHPSNWSGVYGDARTFIDSELLFHYIMSNIIAADGNVVEGLTDALRNTNVQGINFADMVFHETTIVNFVLSDGASLYVFRNSFYRESMHNLTYNVIDGRFIGVKTQEGLDNLIERNQLVEFDSMGNITVSSLDATLPVELSSFNGSVALNGIVTMNWQTSSETGMAGFNLYRGDSSVFSSAVQLNTQLIVAFNNANGSSYQFTDDETSAGQTYYYWLECIDTSGTVSDIATLILEIPNYNDPNIPHAYTTYLLPNFPNPFRSGETTNIPIRIKSGDSGTLSIFNIKGQKVIDFKVDSENSNIIWNGHDNRGKICAPGIYLTHLSSKGMGITRKLLIVR